MKSVASFSTRFSRATASLLSGMALFTLSLPVSCQEMEPEAATGFSQSELAFGRHHMAATANPHATEAAHVMLRHGGSAVDAAIAAQMMLTLVEPQSSGIGGGLFMVYWDAGNDALVTLDGRETAPAAVGPDLFLDDNGKPIGWMDAVVGGSSVGTPGVVAALWQAHQRYGRLPWAELFAPAITLATEGFDVSPRLAGLVARRFNPGLERPGAANDYFFPAGKPLQAGDKLVNPALAATLSAIAKQGPDAFYRGELAKAMVEAVRTDSSRPGLLSLADLADYQPVWREPVCGPYRQYRVCGMGPPSSGAVAVGQILGLLEPYELTKLKPNSTQFIQLFSQASRLAYADRARYLADSDFVTVPSKELLSPDYLAQRRQWIRADKDGGKALPGELSHPQGPDTSEPLPSTSHLVIADGEGNLLSMTSSIEMGFGSTVMVGGFLLNNELTDFSRHPGPADNPAANRVQGGKRPRSSMSPTIVLDNKGPVLAIGSPGGSRIINYVAQTLIASLDWQLPLDQVMALPRVSHRNDYLALEADRPLDRQAEALAAMGHQIKRMALNSGVHAIKRSEQGWIGAADPRREGSAKGH